MSIRMDERILDGRCLRDAFQRARDLMQAHAEEINRLNVFPVPDGDTGTNMFLTLAAVVAGLEEVGYDLPTVLKTVSHHALLGARGNSGVILGQFLVGFAAALSSQTAIDGKGLARGFARGTQEAYHIVSHPKEGTILTIMRTAADEIVRRADHGPGEILTAVVSRAREVLARTPEMLPVLKRAGVVDAGGLGFVYFLETFRETIVGDGDEDFTAVSRSRPDLAALTAVDKSFHRYCTEFTVEGEDVPTEEIRARLASIGDSLLILGDKRFVHVHLHTDDPGAALRTAAAYGRVSGVKIDDMYHQVETFREGKEPTRTTVRTGVVAIVPGDGFAAIMRSLRAGEVLSGQPSVGELLAAIARVPASAVIVLSTDDDMALVAAQAAELSTKRVIVLATGTPPQGVSALLAFDPGAGADEVVLRMQGMAARVRTGWIGRAVRGSDFAGISVRPGDFVGMITGGSSPPGGRLRRSHFDWWSCSARTRGNSSPCSTVATPESRRGCGRRSPRHAPKSRYRSTMAVNPITITSSRWNEGEDEMITAIVLPMFGYLLGSLSLSRAIARAKGIDLPGSTGAQHVARLAGARWGVMSGLFDFGKGLIPVLLGRLLGVNEWAVEAAGVAAVAGHIWPLYYGFHGGRGLNTITGAAVLLLPREIPLAWVFGIGVGYWVHRSEAARRYVDPVAAGAAGGLIGMIVLSFILREDAPIISYTVTMAILPMLSGVYDMIAFFVRLAKGE